MKLLTPADKAFPPRKIRNAAKLITQWAQLHGLTYWRVDGVCDRRALEEIEHALIAARLLEPKTVEAILKAHEAP